MSSYAIPANTPTQIVSFEASQAMSTEAKPDSHVNPSQASHPGECVQIQREILTAAPI